MRNKARQIAAHYSSRVLRPVLEKLSTLERTTSFNTYAIDALKESLQRGSLNLYSVSENLIIVKIFSGLKMCLHPADVAVVPHLALDRIWEEDVTVAWQSVLKPNQIVMDIGANFGYFGLLAAQKFPESESQKVIFFEANPTLIPYIQKTLSINGLHKMCVTENTAISNQVGSATLTVLKDFVGSSSLHTLEHLDSYLGKKMPLETASTIKVSTTTIDEYCKTKGISSVDLMKLDIEGFEDKAFEGMRDVIKKSDKLTVFLEFTRESYDEPEMFYENLTREFDYLYTIGRGGELIEQSNKSYKTVIGGKHDFIMLVLSKERIE